MTRAQSDTETLNMKSIIVGSALVFAAAAQAQTFPDWPLRIIVAFSTGTAADIVARQIEAQGK